MSEAVSDEELKVLSAVADKGGAPIAPTFDFDSGYRFPTIESETGLPGENVQKAIDELVKGGFLEKIKATKILACPWCGSNRVLTHFICPHCRSKDITKELLFEHLLCGVVSREEACRTDDKIVCPSCKKEMASLGTDYLIVGTWCYCNGCQKPFEAPLYIHACHVCSKEFDFRTARYNDVWSYSITSEGVEAAREASILTALQSAAVELGCRAEFHRPMGEASTFNLVVWKGDEALSINATSNDAKRGMKVLASLLAQVSDNPSFKPLIIAVPEAPKSILAFADRYKIEVVEGVDSAKISDKFSVFLKSWAEGVATKENIFRRLFKRGKKK